MATSMKKVEKPVMTIFRILSNALNGRTSARVFLLVKKWVSITRNVITDPIAVARPAPKIPMSSTKTKT
ncbi:unknown [Blautia hydrogenotrophica CAG:147]|nr:unknown [Blautia hydrogenotrophica CAG:147]